LPSREENQTINCPVVVMVETGSVGEEKQPGR
jgi:hypothetical protein